MKTTINDYRFVSIIRNENIESGKLYGMLLKSGKNIILIKYEYDFQFDGFRYIRKNDIIKIEKKGSFHENVLMTEYKNKKIRLNPNYFELDSWLSIIKYLAKTKETIIVENENLNNKEFLFGKIHSFDSDILKIWYVDGEGKQLKKPKSIKIQDITQIQIKCKYIKMFDKYTQYEF